MITFSAFVLDFFLVLLVNYDYFTVDNNKVTCKWHALEHNKI